MINDLSNKTNVIIIGGNSNDVGKHLIKLLVNNDSFNRITSLVEVEDTSIINEKLKQVVVDYNQLEDYKQEFNDKQIAFNVCNVKRKRKKKKSYESDYHYQTQFSTLCKQSGVDTMIHLSSHASFGGLHSKTIGLIEDRIIKENFHYLAIFRPRYNLNEDNSDHKIEHVINKFITTSINVGTLSNSMVYEAQQRLIKSPAPNIVKIYNPKDIDEIINKINK